MAGWLEALAAHARDGTPAVLVTLVEARGSAPREAGAKCVVSATAQADSIGGGTLEHRCVEIARALLADGVAEPALREFPLGPALGQCCGGHVRVLFEPMFAHAWPIALFGAGHVGQALIRLLADLPCRVRWIDPRADAFAENLPAHIRAECNPVPETAAAGLAAGTSVLVMTHDHALDYRIVAACLGRDDLRFVGLIGSATKAARFRARLARDGLAQAALARLICPIGVPGAGGKLPAEIAISAAAQLLQARDAAAGRAEPVRSGNVLPLRAAACAEPCAACAVPA